MKSFLKTNQSVIEHKRAGHVTKAYVDDVMIYSLMF